MNPKLKDIINLILTAILVICALVVVGLYAMNTWTNSGTESQPTKILKRSHELPSYRLPVAMRLANFLENLEKNKEGFRGFPLAPEFATIVTVAGQKMILLPIIMNEPQLAGKLNFRLVDPMKFDKPNQFSEHVIGRRSLWYMPIGATMLYGFLLDPKFDDEHMRIGVGFIFVNRISEDTYDVILKDNKNTVLYAARGTLKKINEEIGEGTLIPLANQQMVKDVYQPEWDMEPEDFILFSGDETKSN